MGTSSKNYREALGQRLRDFRKTRGLTAYRIAKNGDIARIQVKAIEDGDTNYTIDIFLGYIKGCGLNMYFAEKDIDGEQTHNLDDLIAKGNTHDPHL